MGKDKLTINSGKDTNVIGSQVRGDRVETNAKGDLNVESKQDTNMYKESSTSASIGLSSSGVSGSASKGKMNSDYASVTNQAGIYAGNKGFDINVKGNTDLKGAVIDSTASPDKNKLTTGTISFSDIKNKAEYSTSGIGASLDSAATKDKHALLGDKGLIPNIPMSSSDDASSTTKSGIAPGTITITNEDKQKQDISKLNRNTNNTLNKLDRIFDKKTVQEKQELAGLFGELAYNKVHEIANKKGWKDGSAEKNALHAVVGGIMSKLTGSGFISGASGAMVNEMVQNELAKIDDPALHQWASAAIGAAVSGTITENAQAGASSAASGTKNNEFMDVGEVIFAHGEWWIRGVADDGGDLYTSEPNAGTVFYDANGERWRLGYDRKHYYCGEQNIGTIIGTNVLTAGTDKYLEYASKVDNPAATASLKSGATVFRKFIKVLGPVVDLKSDYDRFYKSNYPFYNINKQHYFYKAVGADGLKYGVTYGGAAAGSIVGPAGSAAGGVFIGTIAEYKVNAYKDELGRQKNKER